MSHIFALVGLPLCLYVLSVYFPQVRSHIWQLRNLMAQWLIIHLPTQVTWV